MSDTPAVPPLPSGAESHLPRNPFQNTPVLLDWSRRDIERRLGFRGGRFTNPGKSLPFLLGILLTVAFFTGVILILQRWPQSQWLASMFLDRGPCPYPTVLLFFWALSILFFKWRKTVLQQQALALPVMPQQPDFELTPATARSVRERMSVMVDNPHHFVLLNRIDLALANLHNIGHASDVATILKIQAENDEAQVASSYGLIQGFIWAIPVLGFIGTVLGLSQAIGGFTNTLQSGAGMDSLRSSMQTVTGGLGTAFDTTLIALVCALALQLIVSFLQARESEFLDACNDICHKHVAGKLKLSSH
ncbi:MotA/TolQ/ExbB proton channel family protein [Prosthecobacter fusiformis]|uniref:MotA/TolQ/ExbB proton channel family protein n=1 Tax=Prosthecobacter fusiformis TaxID=48464 RepID=A0A4R7SS44_9BACT|nr:MotA/TolQ/ExbB proton channel family protein [Prosthecobacter fusiformis]TDU81824.1 MotA/TolQ/ExbB proton channel family protein [Prosthecobacter fusiformis]